MTPLGNAEECEAFGDAGFGLLGLGKVVDFAIGKTGGKKVAAKALGTSEKNVKITVTPKQLVSSVAKTVAIAGGTAALLVPGLNVAAAGALSGAAVGVDRLVAASQTVGKAADDAKKVIANTKALAAQGNADAKRGLALIDQVAADRKKKGIPPGKTQPVSPAGEAMFSAFKQIVAKGPAAVKPPSSPAPKAAPAPISAASIAAAYARKPVDLAAQAKAKQLADALSSANLVKAAAPKALPKPAARLMASLDLPPPAPNVVRFTVSDEGRVIRGAVSSLKGWRVYESGKVARQ